jgi:hypothetical protein
VSLLLYAIAGQRPGASAAGVGIDAVPLRRVSEGGLSALVSEHDRVPAPDEEVLWSFEHAIEAEMDSGAVLPVRFGSVLRDAAAVRELLRDRHDELLTQLERIGTAVELSVRLVWPTPAPPPDAPGVESQSGTAYMLARLAPQRRAREMAERLHAGLDQIARDVRYFLLVGPTVPVKASFLVDRERIEEFVTRVRSFETAFENVRLSCTGPWPAYSFVGTGARA